MKSTKEYEEKNDMKENFSHQNMRKDNGNRIYPRNRMNEK